ncbi:MAG TPA: 6-hydroxymethylpterin diphosphokinase MptE-like protein [Alphaproteobacteria bacterium]|nr:6-hydroxymethylpterin diphosphokinase MptE-like protein [Alphaproteobacteria bacterium]
MPTATPVYFVTVKWGFKYGPDYVNIFYDMLTRNLPQPLDFTPRFVCFTDDPSGLDKGIETRPLPGDLKGWWNKLYLFKQGLFEDGARVVYMDLDTAIVGDVRELAGYRGDFAILRDFYRPKGLGSGIMLWRGGFGAHMWDTFAKAGMPEIDGGDQAWIERFQNKPDILQDLFLDAFVSFKESAMLSLPGRARIVCFHGDPKPHEVRNGWLEEVWKIGGTVPNAPAAGGDDPIANVRHALGLPFPIIEGPAEADMARHLCIVGGGASAREQVAELKRRKAAGEEIWALDSTMAWLGEAGVAADAHILQSPDAGRAKSVPAATEATLLYASQCHPEVLARAAAASKRVTLWHPMIDGIRAVMGAKPAAFIGGGTTLGMRAITLAFVLGYRHIHLFGFDSSYRDAAATPPGANDNDRPITVEIDGRVFASTPRLAQQVNEFRLLMQRLGPQGIALTMHGDGLLPYVARKMAQMAQGHA